MGLFVGHGGLILSLRGGAVDSSLDCESLEIGGFELAFDNL